MQLLEGGLLNLMSNILISKKEYTLYGKLEKKEFLQKFCSQIQSSVLKSEFLHRYFSRILLIDSELPSLKIDFFEGIFQELC